MNAKRESLYLTALKQYSWEHKVYELISKYRKSGTLTERSWRASMSYFSLERVNFPQLEKELQASLIRHVGYKAGLSAEELYKIFHDASLATTIPDPSSLKIRIDRTNVSFGNMRFKVPSSFVERVEGTQDQLTDLFVRYSSLGIDTGMFWSLSPIMMRQIQSDELGNDRGDTLECFASPFNFTMSNFCSAFEEDKELSYHGSTCHGDFFGFVEKLTKPFVLVINPPYTDRIINRVGDSVTRYYAKFPEAVMITALPNWKCEGIDQLLSMKGSVSQILRYREFSLFDSIEERFIKPADLDLLVIVNEASDTSRSQQLLESVVDSMRQV